MLGKLAVEQQSIKRLFWVVLFSFNPQTHENVNFPHNINRIIELSLFIIIIHLLPILAYKSIKHQSRCETCQVTPNIAQLCIFLTKTHECTVNCSTFIRKFWGMQFCHQSLYVYSPSYSFWYCDELCWIFIWAVASSNCSILSIAYALLLFPSLRAVLVLWPTDIW